MLPGDVSDMYAHPPYQHARHPMMYDVSMMLFYELIELIDVPRSVLVIEILIFQQMQRHWPGQAVPYDRRMFPPNLHYGVRTRFISPPFSWIIVNDGKDELVPNSAQRRDNFKSNTLCFEHELKKKDKLTRGRLICRDRNKSWSPCESNDLIYLLEPVGRGGRERK